ncbi:MAG: hypothetical protein WD423_10030 [Rhodothermales bacterium]
MAKAGYQNGLTIVTPISEGRMDALRDTLQVIEDDVEENDLVPLSSCERIHFARWIILEASTDATGRPTPAVLIFSTNFDAPLAAHLDELYEHGASGLDRIYSCCDGYPGPHERTKTRVLQYLRDREAGYNTLYVGTRGLTVPRIRREAELRDAIEGFLDDRITQPDFLEQQPGAIREAIRAFVQGRDDLRWAMEAPPEPRRFWPTSKDAWIAIAVLVVVGAPIGFGIATSPSTGWATFGALLGVVAVVLAAGAAVLRYKEKRDRQDPATTNFEHVASLLEREDVRSEGRPIVQNQMSSVTNIKIGWFRRTLLRGVLAAIDVAGRYIYTKGKLGSIPSIHFARWVVIDGGRRLLFFSNFDGSWENYLGDFIDKAASGLTAVWSNTDGFPRSRWLVGDGATDEQRFKAYARNSQTITEVWYSAYKYLSVQNINNNAQLRAGLVGSQTEEDTAAWLRRF